MIALRLPHLPDISRADDEHSPRAVAWAWTTVALVGVTFWGGLAWLIIQP